MKFLSTQATELMAGQKRGDRIKCQWGMKSVVLASGALGFSFVEISPPEARKLLMPPAGIFKRKRNKA
jgi:hypothetical protein